MLYHGENTQGTHKYRRYLQGTQGTHKYILTILCLVLGHVISWRTWTPTRNSRHTQVHINYLMFGAHGEHGHLQGTQGTHKYILTILCLELGHVISMDAYKELKAHTSTY